MKQLEYYISFNDSIGEIIKYNPIITDSEAIHQKILATKSIISILPFKKVFEYNTIVVSMYGFFERFIEDILVCYLDILCHFVPNYNDLPLIIRDNNSLLSAQLIQNLKIPKYENENITSIITKLENCLVKNISELNTIAFTDHSSNFRINSISDFFGRIGIKSIGNRIKTNSIFLDLLIKRLGSNINLSKTEDSIIFFILSDLAQRRNDIAHGTSGSNPILNNSVFPEYFEFLKQFSIVLYSIMFDLLLEFECKKDFKLTKLESIYNHNILCLEIENAKIKVGDRIIVKSGSDNGASYYERIIEEIQINNKSIELIDIDDQLTKVGFRLNGNVKNNQMFFIK